MIVETDLVLLSISEIVPGATDIDAPTFDVKESIWDEEDNTLFNINEESYEYKVYE